MALSLYRQYTDNRKIWQTFRHHSRTFSLAARFLPASMQMPVATLYLFCRRVDSMADKRVLEVGVTQAAHELYALKHQLDQTLAGRPDDDLLWQRLAEVHAAYELNPSSLYDLIDGALWDLEGLPIYDRDDLVTYSDLVGGSIGAMLLPFLVDDPADRAPLTASARHLGVAMQITNIVRDVGEDLAELNRVYLPTAWLRRYGLTAEDLASAVHQPGVPEGYPLLLEHTMETAEALYEKGFKGIPALPGSVRRGILTSALMYREIMNEVRAIDYDNLSERAYVSFPRKLRLVIFDGYEARKERLKTGSRFALAS